MVIYESATCVYSLDICSKPTLPKFHKTLLEAILLTVSSQAVNLQNVQSKQLCTPRKNEAQKSKQNNGARDA